MGSFERVNFSNGFSVNIPRSRRWRLFYLVFAAVLRTLCEPKDVGYSCDFSKTSSNPRFLVQHILDSISRSSSIESPFGLGLSR